jgi:C-terminal processing protease CtpA/Prc
MKTFRWHLATTVLAVTLLSLMSVPAALAADEPIGFALKFETDGFFSSKITRALVTQVRPQSQAQAAGLAVGDELIEVEGVPVPGNSAGAIKPHMQFEPGQPTRLVFKRPSGAVYEATLTKTTAE